MNATQTRIALAHKDEHQLPIYRAKLEDGLGHEVVVATTHGAELVEATHREAPDLLISSVHLADGDGIEFLMRACVPKPRPSIIVTARSDLKHVEHALEDHVMSYLVEPVTVDDLRPSIHLVRKRFDEFEELRREVRDLSEALRARKLIEQAKGRLMEAKGLSESDAHRSLQKLASRHRKKLVEIAEALLIATEL